MTQLRQVIADEEGVARPIYVSEIGWQSAIGEHKQVACMRAGLQCVLSDPSVALGVWFCTQDFTESYGLYRRGDLSPVNRKPAYGAFQQICAGPGLVPAAAAPVARFVARGTAALPPADFALARPLPGDIGWVTYWFGEPVQDYAESNLEGHNGIDYAAPAGSPVLAAHSGQCSRGQDGGYGIYVRITSPTGAFSTIYAHLQDAVVMDGQQVAVGAVIGHVGATGKATGPTLHFGWRVAKVRNPAYGDWLDPLLGRRLSELLR